MLFFPLILNNEEKKGESFLPRRSCFPLSEKGYVKRAEKEIVPSCGVVLSLRILCFRSARVRDDLMSHPNCFNSEFSATMQHHSWAQSPSLPRIHVDMF